MIHLTFVSSCLRNVIFCRVHDMELYILSRARSAMVAQIHALEEQTSAAAKHAEAAASTAAATTTATGDQGEL